MVAPWSVSENYPMHLTTEHVEHFISHLTKKEWCFVSQTVTQTNVLGEYMQVAWNNHFIIFQSYNGRTYINHPNSSSNHAKTSLGNINNKVLAVGHYKAGNKVEIFDIDTNAWTTKTAYPFCSRWLLIFIYWNNPFKPFQHLSLCGSKQRAFCFDYWRRLWW